MNAAKNMYRIKAILWSSNPYDPADFYADKLELLEHEETLELRYRFKVGGRCTEMGPIVKKMRGF